MNAELLSEVINLINKLIPQTEQPGVSAPASTAPAATNVNQLLVDTLATAYARGDKQAKQPAAVDTKQLAEQVGDVLIPQLRDMRDDIKQQLNDVVAANAHISETLAQIHADAADLQATYRELVSQFDGLLTAVHQLQATTKQRYDDIENKDHNVAKVDSHETLPGTHVTTGSQTSLADSGVATVTEPPVSASPAPASDAPAADSTAERATAEPGLEKEIFGDEDTNDVDDDDDFGDGEEEY